MIQEFYQLMLDASTLEANGHTADAAQLYRRVAAINPGYAVPFTRLSIMAARALWGMPPSPRPALSTNQARVSMTSLGANGRFGNQLLQYVYLSLYAEASGCSLEVPDWIGRDLFGCDDPLPSVTLPRLSDTEFDAPSALLATSDHRVNVDLCGYFYFPTKHWQPLRRRFLERLRLRPVVRQWLDAAYDRLGTAGRTVIALHIRHGDFGGADFWIAPTSWYKNWLKEIWHTVERPLLFIATDDLSVLSEFSEYTPLSSKNFSYLEEDLAYLVDFFVLTKADFVATSNSTFSFVATMLNEGARGTVRPDPVARQLVPFDPWDAPIRLMAPWLTAEQEICATEKRVIDQIITDGAVVFDIGAHRGEWSRAVQARKKNYRLHLFESDPASLSVLSAWAEITDPVAVVMIPTPAAVTTPTAPPDAIPQSALSDSAPVAPRQGITQHLLSYWRGLFGSKHARTQLPPLEAPTVAEARHLARVTAVSIDDFCADRAIPHIHFLHISARHTTLDVLQGVKRLLGHSRVDAIQFAYGAAQSAAGVRLRDTFQFLSQYGYLLFQFDEKSSAWQPKWTEELENGQDVYYVALHARLAPYYGVGARQMPDIPALITRHGITVRGAIHVGAHHGEEAEVYRAMGVSRMMMIEANPEVFVELSKNHAHAPDIVLVNCAVSDVNETRQFHVSHFSQSSSLLTPGLTTEIYPNTTTRNDIEVRCMRLDDLLSEVGEAPSAYNILNIDVQGAELLVLRGASHLLSNIDFINVEINFAELYDGCPSIDEVDDYLALHGFRRIELACPFHLTWGDAVYLREAAPPVYRPAASCQIKTLAELLIAHLGVQRHGCFVEVGAFDGETCSNTSFLADLGWRGLYVEPIPAYAQACMHRHFRNPAVDVAPIAVGSSAGGQELWSAGVLTTGDMTTAAIYREIPWTREIIAQATITRVQQERLDTLLHRYEITPHFDLLVIDVGGQEEDVLHSFDLHAWRPRLLIVGLSDDHPDFSPFPEIRQRGTRVRQHIADAGYREVFRDEINTVFVIL